jgi:hypothetical protein
MSEYQYYEFQAIDRPLTGEEVQTLRGYSTRAHITPTSFVNEYNWGDFKGDADTWMEKYFDAHLYFANWGTRAVQFRLPACLLDPAAARQYCAGDNATVRHKGDKVILAFRSEQEEWEEPADEADGPGHLFSLASVRTELACGDLLRAAEVRTAERQRLAAEKAAAAKARTEREAALARVRHLDHLAGQEAKLWANVEDLVATRLPKNYEAAVSLLVDLRDLAVRANEASGFRARLDALRSACARKTGLIDRLTKASL